MPEVLSCPGCGSPVEESQQFCGICGVRLGGVAQQAAPVAPQETVAEQPQVAEMPYAMLSHRIQKSCLPVLCNNSPAEDSG